MLIRIEDKRRIDPVIFTHSGKFGSKTPRNSKTTSKSETGECSILGFINYVFKLV